MDHWVTRKAAGIALLVMVAATMSFCQKDSSIFTDAEGYVPGAEVMVTEVSVPEGNQVLITGNGAMDAYPFIMEERVVAVDVKAAAMASGMQDRLNVGGSDLITDVEVRPLTAMSVPVVRVVVHVKRDVTYRLDNRMSSVALILEATGKDEGMGDDTLPYEEAKEELIRLETGAPPQPYGPGGPARVAASPQVKATSQYSPMLVQMPGPGGGGSATVVGDVLYRTIEDGLQILILTNGRVRDFVDFDLSRPPRIVVDFPGLGDATSQSVYNLSFAGVKSIKVGQHYDKTRVVINLKKLTAYDVSLTRSGVVVTVIDAKYVPGGFNFTEYRTGANESLRDVANKHYGNPEAWSRLLAANRDIFTKRELEDIRRSDGAVILGTNVIIRVPVR